MFAYSVEPAIFLKLGYAILALKNGGALHAVKQPINVICVKRATYLGRIHADVGPTQTAQQHVPFI